MRLPRFPRLPVAPRVLAVSGGLALATTGVLAHHALSAPGARPAPAEHVILAAASPTVPHRSVHASVVPPVDTSPTAVRALAQHLSAQRGWGGQWSCLDALWGRESSWKLDADNPASDAYGIPQALPGSKMASAGADWRTNPTTQIRWGLDYIAGAYGSPCGAWSHEQQVGWY